MCIKCIISVRIGSILAHTTKFRSTSVFSVPPIYSVFRIVHQTLNLSPNRMHFRHGYVQIWNMFDNFGEFRSDLDIAPISLFDFKFIVQKRVHILKRTFLLFLRFLFKKFETDNPEFVKNICLCITRTKFVEFVDFLRISWIMFADF